MTEKPPKPNIAEITGSDILPEQILQPFVTSKIEFKNITIFSLRERLFMIAEIQEKVSTQAEILIIAFAPEETEFIKANSLFCDAFSLVTSVFLSLKNLHKIPNVKEERAVEKKRMSPR